MILFPAIDLKQGQCVRLYQGDMDQATVYNQDPVAQGMLFQQEGFPWLHLVDLDGAFVGESRNTAVIQQLTKSLDIPIQLGGGIRSMTAVDYWLSAGIARVILGTAALTNPDFVRQACQAYPGRIVVGIDAKDGFVATDGWAKTSALSAIEFAQTLSDAGVAALIFTDIARDGTKQGVNVAATAALAKAVDIPVIASGGVATLADIQALKPYADVGIAGVVVGRALYDRTLSAKEALAYLATPAHA